MLRSWPLLPFILVAACGLPRDPDKTSDRIASTHELRVGVTLNDPWVTTGGQAPQGIEADLVRVFANRLDARVFWSSGSETTLAQSLKHGEIDLAIGGFDQKTPWKSIAAVSQPFVETSDKKKHVMLARPGENNFLLTLDTFLTEHMRSAKGAGA